MLGLRLVVLHHGFPPDLTGAGVQAQQLTIGCSVENEFPVDGESPGSPETVNKICKVVGKLAPVLPDQISVGGIESLDDSLPD